MDREKLNAGLRAALRRLPAYVYLDDLLRGRHVLEVGCGDGAGAFHMARAGAASVIALDRSSTAIDGARVRHRVANLSFGVSDFGNIDLEDHTMDVICVPSGEELVRWPLFLHEARRVLGREGLLVVVAASADRPGGRGIGFHDLGNRLAPLFGMPRMIGVTPFVGFSLVEYADTAEVLDIELDSSLVELGGGRDPITEYVAVCGGQKGPARGYMVVEIPMSEGLDVVRESHEPLADSGGFEKAPVREEEPSAAAELDENEITHGGSKEADVELRRRLSRAVEERTGAEAEVQALRARLGQAEEEIGQVAAQAARELGEARRSVHMATARNESLEAQLAEARRGHENRGERERLERELAQAQDRLSRAAAERHELNRRVAELETASMTREDELSALRLETAPLEVMVRAAEHHEAEMRDRLAELAERDAYVEEMRQELEEVSQAERAAAESARDASMRAAELEAETRELRVRLAASEGELLKLRALAPRPGDLVEQRARIAELEVALAERTTAVEKATVRWKETEAKSDEMWRKIGEMQKELVAGREQAVENARAQRQAAQIALTRAVDEASKKLVSAQDLSMRTERERQELEREVLALRPRTAELERERDALLVSAQDLSAQGERERQELERDLVVLRARLADLERERDGLRAELARSDGLPALGELEAHIVALGESLRAEERTLGELTARLHAAAMALPAEAAPAPPVEPEAPPVEPEAPPAPAEAAPAAGEQEPPPVEAAPAPSADEPPPPVETSTPPEEPAPRPAEPS